MESEFTALLQGCQAALPLFAVIDCATKGHKFTKQKKLTFAATIHEHNMGAPILAKLEPSRHTLCLKLYAIKFHWFRSWLLSKLIEIVFVSTHS